MAEVIFIPAVDTGGYIPPSDVKLDLYWDPVDGDNANSGLSTSAPVQTAARLWELLPSLPLKRPVLIHCAGGAAFDFTAAPIPNLIGSDKMLCLYADFAWDPRGDLVSVVATGAAGAGTNGDTCVLPAPVTADLYEALSMRYTTGAAVGQIRTIAQHPTTALTPTITFSPVPAPGDTFEVFTSTAVIAVTTNNYVASGNSGHEGSSNTGVVQSGVAFVNFESEASTFKRFGPGFYLVYGVRLRTAGFISFPGLSTLHMGNAALVGAGVLAVQCGLPQHLWGGWGLGSEQSTQAMSTGTPGCIKDGFVVAKGPWSTGGADLIRGGSIQIINCLSSGGSLILFGPSSALPCVFGAVSRINSVVNFGTNDQLGTIDLNANTLLRHQGAGSTAMQLRGPGILLIGTTALGSQPGTGNTMNVSRGFRVFSRGALNLGRAAGDPNPNDMVVEAVAAFNKTALSAATGANSIRADAVTPGSFIRREA